MLVDDGKENMQDVYNKTPWFNRRGCLQWNELILENDLKIRNFFHLLSVSCLLQEFHSPPIFLGYLTSQRSSTLTVPM
jgi:hypothetical protein